MPEIGHLRLMWVQARAVGAPWHSIQESLQSSALQVRVPTRRQPAWSLWDMGHLGRFRERLSPESPMLRLPVVATLRRRRSL